MNTTPNNTSHSRLHRRLLVPALGLVTASLVTLGFQMTDDDKPSAPPVVELTSDGENVTVPSTVTPGVTNFRLEGSIDDGVNVVRLRDGVTYEEAEEVFVSRDLTRFFTTMVTAVGGITHPTEVNDGTWIVDLEPGDHLAVDLNATTSARFTVTGDEASDDVPDADGTVVFSDGVFTLPEGFGNGTWLVRNDDDIHHELAVITTDDGHSVDQALVTAMAGGDFDSFMHPAGTLNALAPGEEAWVTFSGLRGLIVVGDWLPPLQGVGTAPTLVPVQLNDGGKAIEAAAPPTSTAAATSTTATPRESVALPQVPITASEYAFSGFPDEAPAGPVQLVVENTGVEPHELIVARLNDGVSLEQALAAADPSTATSNMQQVIVPPGGTATMDVDFTPGTWAYVCFISAPDGAPHVSHGMKGTIEITA